MVPVSPSQICLPSHLPFTIILDKSTNVSSNCIEVYLSELSMGISLLFMLKHWLPCGDVPAEETFHGDLASE